jgi:hypothetical protein
VYTVVPPVPALLLQVWQSLFSIRSLVVPMREDVEGWLKFASLCRKSGRPAQAYLMLVDLLGWVGDGDSSRFGCV